MYHVPRLSEAVYVGLCHEVGSPTQVRIRREVTDTEEVVSKPVTIMEGLERMMSGSRREGFRMRTSDIDWMVWFRDHKVICDLSQVSLYRIPQHTVILMECDDLPPGFTRLNLMTPSKYARIISSCVVSHGDVYISSTLFRDNFLRSVQGISAVSASAFGHGPCSTYVIASKTEVDNAICFKSHHWPTTALPWIQRCCQQGWPSQIVVSDILSGGFHVVPIGSTPENGEEWRISFSQAEQKLVYTMNHCQFLCYGLFKIFLKEVINFENNTPVLCSYFIKTIIFWVIQKNNSLTWTPENLLSCFWECFKLLIYWVRIGECPNFFIPQINMFRVKVTGSVQTSLFSQLYDLYCKGIPCLLLSQTLRPYLSQGILNRTLRVCTEESNIISSTELDISLFGELCIQPIFSLWQFAAYMKQIEKVITKRLNSYQRVTLQWITSDVLRNTAFLIQSSIYPNKNTYRNKVYYKANKVFVLLKLSCRFGCMSDILYLAMNLYTTCSYEQSLSCLKKLQEKISSPYNGLVSVDMFSQCTVGMPLGNKIRRALVKYITLDANYTYMYELVLEQEISEKNGREILFIPLLVMLHMLFILNHHRLGDTVRSQQYLRDLHTLLLYDDGIYVPPHLRDISWQILGICQQICGDYLGSFESYQYSLQQKSFYRIQEATLMRMNTLANGVL